jgi:hypothetical protein
MWDGNASGDATFGFGIAGDIPVIGDWNGSGTSKIGIVRNGAWFLDVNGNRLWDGAGGGDLFFGFGVSGDTPLVGQWTK